MYIVKFNEVKEQTILLPSFLSPTPTRRNKQKLRPDLISLPALRCTWNPDSGHLDVCLNCQGTSAHVLIDFIVTEFHSHHVITM